MMRMILVTLVLLLLSGCGEPKEEQEARMQEAREIAALSQDADQHLEGFAGAIAELMQDDDCSAAVMRDGGGFSRATGEDYYFLYCGEPMNKARRWYFDPGTEKLTRFSAEI
ncbi:hypothetical protein [Halomonas sp. 707B3]|uniref:hypothetical protein n=1 Tax=Halomonas sp. 707B3 TaxID=1681043 RepID=UPI0020A0FFAB|nr:hypothetical protein [Halomonas sp. 707B3]MCP1316348.1 hypothetical protein [Halomonas sp. 707B3]